MHVLAFCFSVNAADNKQRDPKMNCIRIDVDRYAYSYVFYTFLVSLE